MIAAPLVTVVISAMVVPRYVQRLISEIAHQPPPKPLFPVGLIFNTLMIVASTIVALPILAFGAAYMSSVLATHKLDVLGSPYTTLYAVNPLWAALGAGLVAAVAHKRYHTESSKLVVILAILLSVAITIPTAPLANVAADAALKVIDGQPLKQSVNMAIGAARVPPIHRLAVPAFASIGLAIFILHVLVADGVMRGQQAHDHWKEIRGEDLILDLDGNPVPKNGSTTGLPEQIVFDMLTGKAMSM